MDERKKLTGKDFPSERRRSLSTHLPYVIIIIIIPYIYIALFWVLKALYIWKEESPQPPPMRSIHLDDATAAILR